MEDGGDRCGAVNSKTLQACVLEQHHELPAAKVQTPIHSDSDGRTWRSKPPPAKPVHPSLKVIKCLCSHTKSRHRDQWGERNMGKCRDCVCEQFELEQPNPDRLTSMLLDPHNKAAPEKPMTKLPPASPLSYQDATVSLDLIEPSPDNKRKHFDETKLAELAADITRHGVLQPPLVQDLEGGKFRLIAGERRWRAAVKAGLKEIRVRVYKVDSGGAAELRLVENDQREDLTPLERAEGYLELQEKYGRTLEQIAEQVGKPKSTVHSALALTKLCPSARKELLAEKLKRSIAELIGQIPLKEHQAEVLELAMGRTQWGQKPPLTFDEVKALIRSEYSLELHKAPFEITDAGLVPGAGSCNLCPKRTGAAADDTSTPLCLDKSCFARKVAAHKRQVVSKAKASDKKVLSAAESKDALRKDGAWVALRETLSASANGKTTVAKALAGVEVETAVAVSPTGSLVAVVRKADVKKVLQEKKPKLVGSSALYETSQRRAIPKTPEEQANEKKRQEEEQAKEELLEQVASHAMNAMLGKIAKDGLPLELLRRALCRMIQTHTLAQILKRRGLLKDAERVLYDQGEKLFIKHFGKATQNELLGLLFEMCDDDMLAANPTPDGPFNDLLSDAAELFKIDLKKLEAELAPKPAPGPIKWTNRGGGTLEGRGKNRRTYKVTRQKTSAAWKTGPNAFPGEWMYSLDSAGPGTDFHGSGPYGTVEEATAGCEVIEATADKKAARQKKFDAGGER